MIKQTKLPTLLGIILLLLGVGASVFLVQTQKQTESEASISNSPQQVRITNISDRSFSVSWSTDKPAIGYIAWGNSSSLGQSTDTEPSSVFHHITITNLSPESTYFFKIGSGKTLFTNQGKLYTVKLGKILTNPPNNDIIFGNILTQSGQPADAVVYVSAQGLSPISTRTNIDGKWSIPLSTSRNVSLSNYVSYTKDTQLDIMVNSGIGKTATAKIMAGSAHPVPSIKIGQFSDFTNLKPTSDGSIPYSQLEIPVGQTTQESSFDLSSFNQTDKKLITLKTPKDREVFKFSKPQFSGTGTPGIIFKISIKSQNITENITVPKNGLWKWTIPNNLENGYYNLAITWKDSAEISRTIERSFTITLPSPSPTPTPINAAGSTNILPPTLAPSPKISPIPSIIPSPTPSPTTKLLPTKAPKVATISAFALPPAGELTMTLYAFIMGLLLVFTGILFPKINQLKY